jgi:hypothetical protein
MCSSSSSSSSSGGGGGSSSSSEKQIEYIAYIATMPSKQSPRAAARATARAAAAAAAAAAEAEAISKKSPDEVLVKGFGIELGDTDEAVRDKGAKKMLIWLKSQQDVSQLNMQKM